MLVALALLWGGTFFLVEIALREVPPLTIVWHRVCWAAVVLWVVLRLTGQTIPRSARFWGACLVMGLLNNALPFSLIFWGQVQIESGLAAILNGTTAVFGAVVAGMLLRDEPLSARRVAGAVLGLAGVAVILGPDLLTGLDLGDLAQITILGAALSYALASVWGRVRLAGTPPWVNAFGMLAASAVLMTPVMLMAEGAPRLDLSLGTWAAVLGLAVLCTAVAYLLYFGILRRAGAANLMLVTLLIPPVAMLLGWAFLGERLHPGAKLGFGIIALGLVVSDGRAAAWLRRAVRRMLDRRRGLM
jgi:drug/metabolite transporter (DMT)-like permease